MKDKFAHLHREYSLKLSRSLMLLPNQFEIYSRLLNLATRRGLTVLFFSPDEVSYLGGYYLWGTVGVAKGPLEEMLPVLAHELGHHMARKRTRDKEELLHNVIETRMIFTPDMIRDFLDDYTEENRAWRYAERLLTFISLRTTENANPQPNGGRFRPADRPRPPTAGGVTRNQGGRQIERNGYRINNDAQ